MGLFNKIFKSDDYDNKQKKSKKYEKDVAQSVTTNLYFEPLDVFVCGFGLYTVMCMAGLTEMNQNIILAEIINLDGKKLSAKVKKDYGIVDCLDDYCFIATPDIVASSKANERKQKGLSNANGLASMNFKKDARTLEDIENVLGCPVLEHSKAKSALFVHKLGVIEIG